LDSSTRFFDLVTYQPQPCLQICFLGLSSYESEVLSAPLSCVFNFHSILILRPETPETNVCLPWNTSNYYWFTLS
jgi:hypothetical protein